MKASGKVNDDFCKTHFYFTRFIPPHQCGMAKYFRILAIKPHLDNIIFMVALTAQFRFFLLCFRMCRPFPSLLPYSLIVSIFSFLFIGCHDDKKHNGMTAADKVVDTHTGRVSVNSHFLDFKD